MTDLFGAVGPITWWQECARTVVVLIYGLILIRVTGRRIFGKWAALDIIVAIIVGSSLSRTITGHAPLGGTLASTTLLMVLHWVLAQLAARWPFASRILEGRPIELAHRGEPDNTALRRQGVSQQDLEEALRVSSLSHLPDTHRVVLEPSGRITVVKG
ncbi:MAG: DUF421 domain-containing protein [Acetobacteraceae bacterium]